MIFDGDGCSNNTPRDAQLDDVGLDALPLYNDHFLDLCLDDTILTNEEAGAIEEGGAIENGTNGSGVPGSVDSGDLPPYTEILPDNPPQTLPAP